MTDEPPNPPVPDEAPNAVLTDSRPTSGHDNSDDREALELHEIPTCEDNDPEDSLPSASSGDEYQVATRRTCSRSISQQEREAHKGLWSRTRRFWGRHVILTVPQKSNRDHFALERTFLAYIRTSTMMAMQGVLVAQLFRLQRPTEKSNHLSFSEVGVPLSVACHAVAIMIALIGACRFWRQQNAMARGKIHAGGWELYSVGILLSLVVVATLVLTIIILIQINMSPSAIIGRIWSS